MNTRKQILFIVVVIILVLIIIILIFTLPQKYTNEIKRIFLDIIPFKPKQENACSIYRIPDNCTTNPEAILRVRFDIDISDRVSDTELEVSSSCSGGGSPVSEDVYSLKILDKNKQVLYKEDFSLGFIVFSDPPIITDEAIFYSCIKYDCHMDELKVYHDDNLVYSKKIKIFCNYNGTCDSGESYWSCISDCEPWAKDGFCNRANDGHCDLDCIGGVDGDCNDEYIGENKKAIILDLYFKNEKVSLTDVAMSYNGAPEYFLRSGDINIKVLKNNRVIKDIIVWDPRIILTEEEAIFLNESSLSIALAVELDEEYVNIYNQTNDLLLSINLSSYFKDFCSFQDGICDLDCVEKVGADSDCS